MGSASEIMVFWEVKGEKNEAASVESRIGRGYRDRSRGLGGFCRRRGARSDERAYCTGGRRRSGTGESRGPGSARPHRVVLAGVLANVP
jgi:hypothetical protein